MPSNRRLRALFIVVVAIVLIILYYTAGARQARSQDFYARTVEKMNEKDGENAAMQEKMSERLQDAENAMKFKVPDRPEVVLSGDKLVDESEKGGAGGKKMSGVASDGKDDSKKEKEKVETQAEHEVEQELNSILKRSPIIIFSKTYCPHSKRAKNILLEKYKIVPSPYVEELDQHPLGQGLQNALEKTTGRRTVPNVLVNGRSIGGGDDVAKLDIDDELVDKIKKMGGKRIMMAKHADAA